MNLIKYMLFLAADIILIGCPVLVVYFSLSKPAYVADLEQHLPSRYRIWAYLFYSVTFLGFGVVIFNGVYFLFFLDARNLGFI